MSDWTGGYVSDIEYTAGFYGDQAPALLDATCIVNGYVPPRAGPGPFRYCELGCGQGLTANLLAAANPLGEFVAVDFNPAHIARARASAEEAGLTNIRFIECGFEELSRLLPDGLVFDYVTLHGVYSWIGPATRRALVEFLRERVRPGGAVYVSYNAMPAWSELAPLQRLLRELAHLSKEPSDRSIRKAVSIADRMLGAESPYLQRNKVFEPVRQMAQRGEISYLAHEYINDDWHPMYHADVARELADAKLAFVGSAKLTDNFPGLTLSPAQREILDEVGASEVRETLKDYFWVRSFRKDVFLRGARRLPLARRNEMARAMQLALVVPRAHATLQLEVPLGKADLEPRTYAPMLDALAEGPQTVERLIELGEGRVTPVEVAGLLIGSGQVLPVQDTEAPADRVRQFNVNFASQARFEELNRVIALASPVLGSGIAATVVDLVVYLGLSKDPGASVASLAEAVWAPIADRGEKLLQDGKPVESEAESLAILRDRVGVIVKETAPIWRALRAM